MEEPARPGGYWAGYLEKMGGESHEANTRRTKRQSIAIWTEVLNVDFPKDNAALAAQREQAADFSQPWGICIQLEEGSGQGRIMVADGFGNPLHRSELIALGESDQKFEALKAALNAAGWPGSFNDADVEPAHRPSRRGRSQTHRGIIRSGQGPFLTLDGLNLVVLAVDLEPPLSKQKRLTLWLQEQRAQGQRRGSSITRLMVTNQSGKTVGKPIWLPVAVPKPQLQESAFAKLVEYFDKHFGYKLEDGRG